MPRRQGATAGRGKATRFVVAREMTIKYISLGTLKSSIFVDGFSMKPSIGEGYVVCMYVYIYIYMYIYLGKL